MEDRNSPEAIAARSNQEDPIVMYLIVRESLGMSAGKLGAQCGHASQMVLLQYIKELRDYENSQPCCNYMGQPEPPSQESLDKWSIFELWLNTSFRKVVLRADDKEWIKLKELANHIVVVDAGLTEVAAGSETVIGFWPMRKSERPKLIKKLQVLK